MKARIEGAYEAEAGFDLWRRRAGLLAGPFAGVAVFASASGLPAQQRCLAAILAFVIVYWVSEAIPIPATALLGPALCVLFGVGNAREVFRYFGDPVIFVFLGSFLIARAMTVHGLDRRIALRILQSPAVGRSPARIRLAMGGAALLLSMWISNTATVAILFPIAVGISDSLDRLYSKAGAELQQAGRRYATGLMLMVAYAASIGGLGTPVGSPPNLIGIGMMETLGGRRIPFFEWMMLGVPIMIAMFGALCLVQRFFSPSPGGRLHGLEEAAAVLKRGLPAWGHAQTHTLAAFFLAVILWILPGIVALLQGTGGSLYRLLSTHLHEGVVALLAGSVLFLIPVRWSPPQGVLQWRDAAHIDWGTILLFGGGLSLGGLMYSTGLAQRLADGLLGATGYSGLWTITAFSMLFALVITETTSNTASASMVIPVAIAVSQAAGVSPIPPAIGATIASSLAFMLPVSTPPNAIVYGSGRVSLIQMFRAGFLLDLIGLALLLGVLRFLCTILGLA